MNLRTHWTPENYRTLAGAIADMLVQYRYELEANAFLQDTEIALTDYEDTPKLVDDVCMSAFRLLDTLFAVRQRTVYGVQVHEIAGAPGNRDAA